MTVPSEVPIAAIAQATSAHVATGPRSRRQSTVRAGSDGVDDVVATASVASRSRVDIETTVRRSADGRRRVIRR